MCKWGADAHVVLPSGKTIAVDQCIADFVDRLNKAGIETVASCCGHGNLPTTIALTGDRWLILTDRETRERIEAMLGVDIHGNALPRECAECVPEHDPTPMCADQSRLPSRGWQCTRPAGHSGNHVACSTDAHGIATWPQIDQRTMEQAP